MTKHLSPDWMQERGYITEEQCAELNTSSLVPNKDWGQQYTVSDLKLAKAVFLEEETTIRDVIMQMEGKSFDQFPVMAADGKIVGVVTAAGLATKLIKNKVTLEDKLGKAVQPKDLRHVSAKIALNELTRILARNKFVLVERTSIVTMNDILTFYQQKNEKLDIEVLKRQNSDAVSNNSGASTASNVSFRSTAMMSAGLGLASLAGSVASYVMMKKN